MEKNSNGRLGRFIALFTPDNIEFRGVWLHTKKNTAFEQVEHILCALEVSPPTSKYWPSPKKWLSQKWLYLWNYRKFFGSENFVGVLGIHIPCLDASQTLIWLEHDEEFIL